jgi:hypothetical protein
MGAAESRPKRFRKRRDARLVPITTVIISAIGEAAQRQDVLPPKDPSARTS